MHLVPLGDQAVLAYCDDELAAAKLAGRLRGLDWPVDVVQAYTSVAAYFDLRERDFEQTAEELRRLEQRDDEALAAGKDVVIPCCYEMGLDLDRVARHVGLDVDRVIRLHTQCFYTVYAIGFCPGFPYLGYLPKELAGVPRLESPRLRVEAGSVGMTGRQTGIYTEAKPGGWNILGRTPLELVNVADGYFPLRTGDRVRFERIDEREFQRLQSSRL